jgi:hypothetical protein
MYGIIWQAWNKYLKEHSFVSWFTILLQNDAGIAYLLGFARVVQYFSKFQKICYKAQGFYGIP